MDSTTIAAIIGSFITAVLNVLGSVIVAKIQISKNDPAQKKPRFLNKYLSSLRARQSLYPVILLVAVFSVVAILVSTGLSVYLIYALRLDRSSATAPQKQLLLEIIQFDYSDSPTNHGWSVPDGKIDTVTFRGFNDSKVGRALEISTPLDNYYALDYSLSPTTGVLGNYLEAVTKYSDDSACIYAYVEMSRKDGTRSAGWLKFKPGDGAPKFADEDEWVVEILPVTFSDTSWVNMKIDLEKAVQDTFGKDGWSFEKTRRLRIRGNISLDSIAIYQSSK